MSELDKAVEHLTTTFQSLGQIAAGYMNIDPQEVADQLKTTSPDTAEYIALTELQSLIGLPKAKVADSSSK
jgi:hypothetical protein